MFVFLFANDYLLPVVENESNDDVADYSVIVALIELIFSFNVNVYLPCMFQFSLLWNHVDYPLVLYSVSFLFISRYWRALDDTRVPIQVDIDESGYHLAFLLLFFNTTPENNGKNSSDDSFYILTVGHVHWITSVTQFSFISSDTEPICPQLDLLYCGHSRHWADLFLAVNEGKSNTEVETMLMNIKYSFRFYNFCFYSEPINLPPQLLLPRKHYSSDTIKNNFDTICSTTCTYSSSDR